MSRDYLRARGALRLGKLGTIGATTGLSITGADPAAPTPGPPSSGLPARIVGGYHLRWTTNEGAATPLLTDLHPNYNVVLMSFALGTNNGGDLRFTVDYDTAATKAAMAQMRAERGTKFLLSIGGQNAGGFLMQNSGHVEQFKASYDTIQNGWGMDGVDWDLENDQATWGISAVKAASDHLKAEYGSSFAIACAAQPAVLSWKQWAQQMGNNLDFFGMQFYDYAATDAERISGIKSRINQMVTTYGVPASKLGVGCKTVRGGSPSAAHVSSAAVFAQAVNELQATYPALRGAYVWQTGLDKNAGFPFATTVGSAVLT